MQKMEILKLFHLERKYGNIYSLYTYMESFFSWVANVESYSVRMEWHSAGMQVWKDFKLVSKYFRIFSWYANREGFTARMQTRKVLLLGMQIRKDLQLLYKYGWTFSGIQIWKNFKLICTSSRISQLVCKNRRIFSW